MAARLQRGKMQSPPSSQQQPQMNGVTLATDTSERDLGVTIDGELKFHNHIARAVNKASRKLGLV